MPNNDKLNNWKDTGFNQFQERAPEKSANPGFMGGAKFDSQLDDLLFNRMIKLRDLRIAPQGNDPGKIYWDGENKKYKIWVDSTGGWADVVFTTTSTSTSTT